MLIDVHAHLTAPEFKEDLGEILDKCKKRGIIVITSGLGCEDAIKAIEIAKKFDNVCCTIGIDPIDYSDIDKLIDLIKKNQKNIVGIGEVGMDRFREKDREKWILQEERFREMIRIAKELDLPVITHSRSAGKRVIEILIEEGVRKVIMHAFDGKYSSAKQGIENEYYFSIPPSLLRSEQKQKFVKLLPLENILLESDSPVLGPNPRERNTPLNIIETINKISEIKSQNKENITEIIEKNTKKLFKNEIKT